MDFRSIATAALLAFAFEALGAPRVDACRALDHHGKRAEANVCFTGLTRDPDPYLRAEGLYGLRRYREAHETFRAAVDRNPKNPDIKVRWGRLLIEPFNQNKQDGAGLFQEALEVNKDHTGALLGLAMIASESFEAKADELARKVLEIDPKNVDAQELLANLAPEDSKSAKAVEEADKALKISPEALDALAIRAAVEMLADRPADEWLKRMYAVNPVYGQGHALIAHHLVINRRYVEGIEQYRKALELDPEDLYRSSQPICPSQVES